MQKLKTVVCSLLVLSGMMLSAASCSRQSKQAEPEGTVARIGDRFITQDDVRSEILRRQEAGQRVGSANQILEELLRREALILRAEQLGLADDPEVRRDIERLLIARLRERELSGKVQAFSVPDEAVREEYLTRIEKYSRPALDRFAVLFLRLEKNAGNEKRAQVFARLAEAKKLVDAEEATGGFGSLSVNYSDEQASRYRGGDIGWVARNKTTTRIPESVLETGRSLELGGLSNILETDDGVYLIMKTDTRPASITEYEQVQGALRQKLLAEGRRQIEENYFRNCVEASSPDVNWNLLRELDFDFEEKAEQSDAVPVLAAGSPSI